MTIDSQTRAVNVLAAHQAFDGGPGILCGHPLWSLDNCKQRFDSYEAHRAHVAAALAVAAEADLAAIRERIAQAIEALPGPGEAGIKGWPPADQEAYLLGIEEAAQIARAS